MTKSKRAPRVKRIDDTQFRVYRLPKSDRIAAARARTAKHLTQKDWLQSAVDEQLPVLRDELHAVFGDSPKDARGPCRLPMSDASLATLKTASKVTGIPAARLLELCVRRAAVVTGKPSTVKRGRKAR